MRHFIFAAPLFFLGLVPGAQADEFYSPNESQIFDFHAERQISETLRFPEFYRTVINYQFSGRIYPITLIHNPRSEMLWGNGSEAPISLSLIMTANLPFHLAHRLEEYMISLGKREDCYIDLRGFGSASDFNGLVPVVIAERIDDPRFDASIQEAFRSPRFINQVYCYHLGKKYYKVRILHNPEERTFTTKKSFRLFAGDSLNSYSIEWNNKYGIILDQPAPQELIDHLSAFTNASWWDWYFNFQVHNGDYVEYKEHRYGYQSVITTTYDLDTWFNYTADLQ